MLSLFESLRTALENIFFSLGGRLVFWGIKILGSTTKLEEANAEIPRSFWRRGVPGIGAFWHGRIFLMPLVYKGKKPAILISPHRDARALAQALGHFGFRVILGSTYQDNISAFRKLIRASKDGLDPVIVPDGPRGPSQRAQPGIIELARLTGMAIVPVTFSASRKHFFRTWDQFLLPYPFSKCICIWGEPIQVNPHGDAVHVEEMRALLERRLNEITKRADEHFR
jgi:lysophospholipid acyltransferase (LPLAT)-like uncharacterized protein